MGEGAKHKLGLWGLAQPALVWFLISTAGCAFEKCVGGPVARQVPSRSPGHRKQLLVPGPGSAHAPWVCCRVPRLCWWSAFRASEAVKGLSALPALGGISGQRLSSWGPGEGCKCLEFKR